ncbi:4-(cytidine 5'-diphospho)-2-C-methyl-D-erythritol kinase [Promicromonospora sp. NPDC090134]|uniref:4-(cytidine 5'-diphospho)-2-C-methyl-D-erythritol kinase n=1 Tax=Promicromonospora sp. NPDC090134 TaxID=3364408 RepID=UPI00381EB2C0
MIPRLAAAPPPSVRVRAPGKVNLGLRVGPVGDDGYHPLATIFQAVSLFEEVTATQVAPGAGISLTVSGPQADVVPTDETNLAWRAAALLAERTGLPADVQLHLTKGVPVAGGMAGGSADAAAALVACDALWEAGIPRPDLVELAAELGADVPFSLLGHTAVGTGRGDLLTPAMTRGEFHWCFATQREGLSTPTVFRRFDELAGPSTPRVAPTDDTAIMHALRAGDAVALGKALHNDLEGPALDLRPELAGVLEVATESGALGVVVSGSGPTVAALGRSRQHALALGAAWTAADVVDAVWCATGPAPGTQIVTPMRA